MFYDGSERVRIVGGPTNYYEEYTTTNLYVEKVFGGFISTLTISNDSEDENVQASYDGATLEAELKPEESITLNVKEETSVRIKSDSGGDTVRMWGW